MKIFAKNLPIPIGMNSNSNGNILGAINRWRLKMIYKSMYGHK